MQIQCLEESAEALREKSVRFYKGCRKYTYVCCLILPPHISIYYHPCINSFKLCYHFACYSDGLGDGHDRDVAFASSLETFGEGPSDPTCVSFGGKNKTVFSSV